jgi:hypothetical protein
MLVSLFNDHVTLFILASPIYSIPLILELALTFTLYFPYLILIHATLFLTLPSPPFFPSALSSPYPYLYFSYPYTTYIEISCLYPYLQQPLLLSLPLFIYLLSTYPNLNITIHLLSTHLTPLFMYFTNFNPIPILAT